MIRAIVPALAAAVLAAGDAAPLRLVPAGDPALVVEGAAAVELVDDGDGRRLRLHRPIDMPGKGYGWDNPGATVRFRTDARSGELRLRYSERHVSTSARNSIGLILVDGAPAPAALVRSAATAVQRPVELAAHPLPVPAAAGMHEYTYVMPYGDAVEVVGVAVAGDAAVSAPEPRRRPRWVAYGDSVTQGFDASHVGASYAWRTAAIRGWELVNIAVGGRASTVADADAVAGLKPDVVSVAIGVNDWQGGVPVATYRERLGGMLARLRSALPGVPVAVISPLWVAPSWSPAKAAAPLDEYRAAAAAAATAAGATLIDGPALIEHDPKLFNSVAVHPNDAGFTQMAERLAPRLPAAR